jgi:uncharacterized protein YyaL (SSP411 family)
MTTRFLIAAALELLQARFANEDLTFARQLADKLLEQFEDAEGGFLLHQPRP